MKNFESSFWTDLEPPMSINAKIKFEGGVKSAKLIRNLMNLCFNFGIGLTSPMLFQENKEDMMFLLKDIIPGTQYAKKNYGHIKKCVSTIKSYLDEVEKQMDFVILDVSMFSEFDVFKISFDSIVNKRDNRYNGSWQNYLIDLQNTGKTGQIKLIEKCIEFEQKNQTDLGIVSGQIMNLLNMNKAGIFDYDIKN